MTSKILSYVGLAAAAVVGGILYFWGVEDLSLQSDIAHYAVRAQGWFDFMGGSGQTGPIYWFGENPWWGNLGFHDHPFLGFFIHWVFFAIFGDSTFVALLPTLLGSIAGAFVVFFFARRFISKSAGFAAGLLFGLSSYAIWSGRTGNMESLEIPFILAAFYGFWSYLENKKSRPLYLSAAATAAAILIKYTALFIPASIFLYILIFRRETFRDKRIWVALLLFIAVLSPMIIYNVGSQITRGHPDLGFSTLLNIKSDDFSAVNPQRAPHNFITSYLNIWLTFFENLSAPLALFIVVSLLISLVALVRRKSGKLETFLFVAILFASILLTFIGAAARYELILLPICLLLAFAAFIRIFPQLVGKKLLSAWLVFFVIMITEVAYAYNTNVSPRPIGAPRWMYATSRIYANGFGEFDGYMATEIFTDGTEGKEIKLFEDAFTLNPKYRDTIIILDEQLNWFSRFWHAERYLFYYGLPVTDFSDISRESEEQNKDILTFLVDSKVRNVWFILARAGGFSTAVPEAYNRFISDMEKMLDERGIPPEIVFTNYLGDPAIAVYHVRIGS